MKSEIERLIQIAIEHDDTLGDRAKAEFERLKAVVHAARETRKAQEAYYRGGRTQTALRVSRQWEIHLDRALAALWSETPSDPAWQDKLL